MRRAGTRARARVRRGGRVVSLRPTVPPRRKLVAPEQLCQLVTRNGTPVLRCQVGEQDPALPAREALLVQACAVRLDGETFRQRDPNLQGLSFRGPSGALASL